MTQTVKYMGQGHGVLVSHVGHTVTIEANGIEMELSYMQALSLLDMLNDMETTYADFVGQEPEEWVPGQAEIDEE